MGGLDEIQQSGLKQSSAVENHRLWRTFVPNSKTGSSNLSAAGIFR